MDWLEQELKQALERKMPASDFAARVTAAAERGALQARWRLPRRPPLRWMAAAALLLVASGAMGYREYRGRVAKARVMLALRITGGRLNYVQKQALRASREARP